MSEKCIRCGKVLDGDDIGAYRKFVDRTALSFLCVPCLSVKAGKPESYLREKILYLKKSGCTLFPPEEKT